MECFAFDSLATCVREKVRFVLWSLVFIQMRSNDPFLAKRNSTIEPIIRILAKPDYLITYDETILLANGLDIRLPICFPTGNRRKNFHEGCLSRLLVSEWRRQFDFHYLPFPRLQLL